MTVPSGQKRRTTVGLNWAATKDLVLPIQERDTRKQLIGSPAGGADGSGNPFRLIDWLIIGTAVALTGSADRLETEKGNDAVTS